MKTGDVYGGNWLEADDLGGREVRVTIESVSVHEMNDGKRKAALHFVGKDKALLLNVTNASVIEGITGTDEMDEWAGTAIVLYKDPSVMFQGKRVGGLRVKAVQAAARPAARPVPRPAPVAEPAVEDNTPDYNPDSDIPF